MSDTKKFHVIFVMNIIIIKRQYNVVKVAKVIVRFIVKCSCGDLLNRWKWVFISINWWKAVCAIPFDCSKTFVSLLFIFHHERKCHKDRNQANGRTDRQSTEWIRASCSFIHSLTHAVSHISQCSTLYWNIYLSRCLSIYYISQH